MFTRQKLQHRIFPSQIIKSFMEAMPSVGHTGSRAIGRSFLHRVGRQPSAPAGCADRPKLPLNSKIGRRNIRPAVLFFDLLAEALWQWLYAAIAA
jgi:hypothetical protein